jgi:putative tricarboxylic transport membrane protein
MIKDSGAFQAALAAFALALTLIDDVAAQEWKPVKPVELVATNAPGGGSDRIGRIMIKIMQDRKLVPTAINLVNKPGGGSAVAYNYINQYPGNGHFLVLGSRSLLTNHIAGHGPNPAEFTPVAHLFDEYIAVAVKPLSPIRTGKDLLSFMKRDPTAISFGIATSLGAPNHSGVAAPFKAVGIDVKKMKNVIFSSGGAASTALMGGHVDVVPISVAFAASLYRNRQVRLIAITAPERLGGDLKDVPTWKEQGANVVVAQWRVLIGPKGMPPEQISYWENTMKRLMEAEDWKNELDTNFWRANFEGSAATRKFLAKDHEEAKAFLSELGLAK